MKGGVRSYRTRWWPLTVASWVPWPSPLRHGSSEQGTGPGGMRAGDRWAHLPSGSCSDAHLPPAFALALPPRALPALPSRPTVPPFPSLAACSWNVPCAEEAQASPPARGRGRPSSRQHCSSAEPLLPGHLVRAALEIHGLALLLSHKPYGSVLAAQSFRTFCSSGRCPGGRYRPRVAVKPWKWTCCD